MKFPRLAALFVILAAVLSAAVTPPETRPQFKTTPVMKLEAATLVQMLEYYHYNREAVRATDYNLLITDYMAELDPQRLFFTADDEQTFRKQYGQRLETDLAYLGNMDSAFEIFLVYQKRVQQRATWIFEQLAKEFDLSAQETYTPDRSKSPFPATLEAADDLWRRRIKFEIIQDILAKKTLEEAKTKVHKRYDRMLKNLDDIEPSDVQEMFLSSLTRQYDPHSAYLSSDTLQDFSIQMKLSLIGIGAVLSIEDDGNCVIRELVPGGPAFNSGQIHMNDKIIAVKQEGAEPIEVIGMKLRRIVDMIRGNKDTKVTLTILPHDATDSGKTKEVVITRDLIKLNSARASASIFEVPAANNQTDKIGVITLNSFYGPSDDTPEEEGKNTASSDVAELIGKLKAEGIQALVIDLRRNGGGLLSEAVDLTGLFIRRGPVVQVKDSLGKLVVDDDTNDLVAYDGPLAVLTSRFSASASEIFAGALQNYGRAVIIGDSTTHGKGTVQAVLEMKNFMPRLRDANINTGAAKLTVQKFYLPNGSSTQVKGVVPDITLPSIEDFLPIGEADLPHALLWDEIKTTRFDGKPLPMTFIKPLLESSRERQATLEEFSMLKQNIEWFKTKQEQKAVSVNLAEREAQKKADDDFKKAIDEKRDLLAKNNFASKEVKLDSVLKSEAAGTPPPKTTATEDGEPESADKDDESKLDIHLRETLRIVSDALKLNQNPAYWADGRAPITAALPLNKG